MNVDNNEMMPLLFLIKVEVGSTKKTDTLPVQPPKVEGELEADDCYNSMPGKPFLSQSSIFN